MSKEEFAKTYLDRQAARKVKAAIKAQADFDRFRSATSYAGKKARHLK